MLTNYKEKYTEQNIFFKFTQEDLGWNRGYINFAKHRQAGFFLIEGCMALVIMGMVLLAVVPAWILLQQKLEHSHERAVSLVVVQNEIETFNHYLEETGTNLIIMNGYPFEVSWEVSNRGNLEEGRLYISWDSVSRKREEENYRILRLKKDIFLGSTASP